MENQMRRDRTQTTVGRFRRAELRLGAWGWPLASANRGNQQGIQKGNYRVSLIRCRNCEKIQSTSSSCRRCGHSLASFDRIATPVPPSITTTVTVEKPDATPVIDVTRTIAEIERTVIMARVEHHRGNLSAAARSLGINEATIHRKLKAYKRCNGLQNASVPRCEIT